MDFNYEAWRAARPGDISRRKLAEILGTSDSNLISIEKGDTKPSMMLALRYCTYTGLPMDLLCLKK